MKSQLTTRALVDALLANLPERLKYKEFAHTYNKAKTLYSQALKDSIPVIDGVPRDEVITCLAAIFRDRFVAHKLAPIYLYYEKPLMCLRWLKGQLNGVAPLQAALMKEMMLQIINKKGWDETNEQEFNFIIGELMTFDYTNSDIPPLDVNTNWINFFQEIEEFEVRINRSKLFELYDGLSIKYCAADDRVIKGLEVLQPFFPFQAVPEELFYYKPIFDESSLDNNSWNSVLTGDLEPKPMSLKQETIAEKELKNPDHTMPRKVIAIYYILEYLHVRQVDRKQVSRFIEFLTGYNEKNIYDALSNPLMTEKGNYRIKDIEYVKPFFEKLGLKEIVKLIDNDLEQFAD